MNDVQIIDKTADATRKITSIADRNARDLTEDTAKMVKAMMGDAFKKASTGALASSISTSRNGEMDYELRTNAYNTQGVGYGAKQEWGWHDRSGKKRKGRHIILRATWGMRKRYERGEKWKN